jgi:PAS domain S-box-containing protein
MIGKLSQDILESLLETLPVDFSVLDANDKVLAWNKHDTRIFKRPQAVLGRDVRNCHPQKSLARVEQLIAEMKSGKRDKARFWIDMGGDRVLIEYFALKDSKGTYLGCLEVTQKITDIQNLTEEKRLLD